MFNKQAHHYRNRRFTHYENYLIVNWNDAAFSFAGAIYSYGVRPKSSTGSQLCYLGSLNFPDDASANSQKLQVNIMGGAWGANDKGMISFYIANRGGLSVNQVTAGGSIFDGRSIIAYHNGYNADFYLAINSNTTYYSFAVNAYLFGYATANGPINITTQTATPAGTDITSLLQVNPVQVTDMYGNIGVNTFSPDPAFKFSVNGKIRAKEIKVETGWADYVFDDDYKLPNLSQVQNLLEIIIICPIFHQPSMSNKWDKSAGDKRLVTKKSRRIDFVPA